MRTECEAYTAGEIPTLCVALRVRLRALPSAQDDISPALQSTRRSRTSSRSDFSSKALLCLFIRKADFIASLPRLPRPQAFQARRSPSISSTKCISRFRVCEIISTRCPASTSHARPNFRYRLLATKRALVCVLRKFIARQTESQAFTIVKALPQHIAFAPANIAHRCEHNSQGRIYRLPERANIAFALSTKQTYRREALLRLRLRY